MTPHENPSDLSILGRINDATVYTEPYPYIVIENALPADIYAELEQSFPDAELVMDGRPLQDTWYDYPACRVLKDSRISALWRDFFNYHVSEAFFREFATKMGGLVSALHPHLATRMNKELFHYQTGMRPGGRGNPFAKDADISLECQFYVNHTRQPRAVRGPHVDRPTELFAALLYFRDQRDDSTGGDLAINKASDQSVHPSGSVVRVDGLPMEVSDQKVTTVNIVKYAPNTLVLFLNSAKSLHAVTPRSPTLVPRRHINFCGDITVPLFDIHVPRRLKYKEALAKTPVLWRLAEKL